MTILSAMSPVGVVTVSSVPVARRSSLRTTQTAPSDSFGKAPLFAGNDTSKNQSGNAVVLPSLDVFQDFLSSFNGLFSSPIVDIHHEALNAFNGLFTPLAFDIPQDLFETFSQEDQKKLGNLAQKLSSCEGHWPQRRLQTYESALRDTQQIKGETAQKIAQAEVRYAEATAHFEASSFRKTWKALNQAKSLMNGVAHECLSQKIRDKQVECHNRQADIKDAHGKIVMKIQTHRAQNASQRQKIDNQLKVEKDETRQIDLLIQYCAWRPGDRVDESAVYATKLREKLREFEKTIKINNVSLIETVQNFPAAIYRNPGKNQKVDFSEKNLLLLKLLVAYGKSLDDAGKLDQAAFKTLDGARHFADKLADSAVADQAIQDQINALKDDAAKRMQNLGTRFNG